MKTSSKIVYLVIGLAIAPIILNILIGFEHPHNIQVVGDATDWLNFYGGYLGSAIAVIGALYVCKVTINNERQNQANSLFYTEILGIQNELAKRFESFYPEELLLDSPFREFLHSSFPSSQAIDKEENRLHTLYCKCHGLRYSASFLYYDESSSESKEFATKYRNMMDFAIKTIDYQISSLDNNNSANWPNNVQNVNNMIDQLLQYNQDAIVSAHKYVETLIKVLNQKQEEEYKN
jgi:hypothetical protein